MDSAELSKVTVAAEYVVALLNLRGMFANPTMYDRTIVSYRCPRVVDSPRYFIVMDINEGDDSFLFMIETYQDQLRNWQPIIPTPTKNFKYAGSNGQSAAEADINFDLWFGAPLNDPVVLSAITSARAHLESSYFPMTFNKSYSHLKPLHAELLTNSAQDLLLRRQGEAAAAAQPAEAAAAAVHAAARSLSRSLAVRRSRILERESRRDGLRRLVRSNATEDGLAPAVARWLRYEAEHRSEMERLAQVRPEPPPAREIARNRAKSLGRRCRFSASPALFLPPPHPPAQPPVYVCMCACLRVCARVRVRLRVHAHNRARVECMRQHVHVKEHVNVCCV